MLKPGCVDEAVRALLKNLLYTATTKPDEFKLKAGDVEILDHVLHDLDEFPACSPAMLHVAPMTASQEAGYHELRRDLFHEIKDEANAAQKYSEMATKARQYGDIDTAKVLQAIAEDEKSHKSDLGILTR